MDYGKICSASSEARSLKITWKIPEYLSLPDTSDSVDSSPFIFANASWYLKIHRKKLHEMSVSLVRLHSLLYQHKITCMFDVLKQNGDYFTDEHEREYRPLKFYDTSLEYYNKQCESYKIKKISNRSEFVSDEEILTQDGTLVIRGHLLFEESIEEEHIQNCSRDNSTMYKKGEMEKNSTILSLSYSKVQSLKITWKVPNYQSILENELGYSLKSPSFDFGCATWFLKLYPVGVEDHDCETGLSIVRSHSLVSLHHEILYTWDYVSENDKPFDYNFYNNYTFKVYSFNEESKMKESRQDFCGTRCLLVDCLAVDNDRNLTFLIQIFYDEAQVKDAAMQKMLDELNMYGTFREDLKNFLLNGSGHDLILKVKEKEFKVHRQILSSRSPVFASMLIHDMTEKNCGVVNIPDCDPPVIEQFLLYVYCGKMDSLDENNVQGLYYVADKYDMKHLKEICRGFIRNLISSRNVCDIVQLAMNHSDEGLVEFGMEFFVKNKDEILTTAEWASFVTRSEDIAKEILNKASGNATGQNKKRRISKKEDTRKEEDNL